MRLDAIVVGAWLLTGCSWFGPSEPAGPSPEDCAALVGADLAEIGGPGSSVTSAVVGTTHGYPACEVEGTLAPSIRFQLALPTEGYTGRYLHVGCRWLCGRVNFLVSGAEQCAPLDGGGFAKSASDMGHDGATAEFGDDPQKRIDFAYRGVHVTALASKELIRRYYGRPPEHSYFSGCGDGGREGLMEALRYPDDFDGIVAGAPVTNFVSLNSFFYTGQTLTNQGEKFMPVLRDHELEILHDGAMVACDELDGLKDGIIDDPRKCDFDPVSVRCRNEGDEGCLHPIVSGVAARLYRGPVAEGSELPMYPGGPMPGSELAWKGVWVPRGPTNLLPSARLALNAMRHVVMEENPELDYNPTALEFSEASFAEVTKLHGLYDTTDPDLRAFVDKGGKLVLWHGWADQYVPPLGTVAYYDAVEALLGPEKTREGVRLFMVPGMYHCYRGTGPHWFDMLGPLMSWVEEGRAPEQIIAYQGGEIGASHPIVGKKLDEPERSRPLFPYPKVARYKGTGSVDEASSFEAVDGDRPPVPRWLGSDFYAPGQRLDCAAKDGALACERGDAGGD